MSKEILTAEILFWVRILRISGKRSEKAGRYWLRIDM